MTKQVKTYQQRGSATQALKQLGVPVAQYDRFLTHTKAGYEVDLVAAERSLKRQGPRSESVASFIKHELLTTSLTNEEIFKLAAKKFGLGPEKKGYPGWYRAQLRRDGKL